MSKAASRWTVTRSRVPIPGIGYEASGPGAYNRIVTNTSFSLVALESSKTFTALKDTYKITGVRSFWKWILEHHAEHADELRDVFTELSIAENTCGTIKIDLRFTSHGPPVNRAFGYIEVLSVVSKIDLKEPFTVVSLCAPTEDTGAGYRQMYDLPTKDNHSSIHPSGPLPSGPLGGIEKTATQAPVEAKELSVARLDIG